MKRDDDGENCVGSEILIVTHFREEQPRSVGELKFEHWIHKFIFKCT